MSTWYRPNLSASLVLLFVLAPFAALVALGQDEPPVDPAPAIDWLEHLAIAINMVLVPLAVQLLARAKAGMSSTLKQILALALSPVLLFASGALSDLLGHPIDLSTIGHVFTAATVSALGGMGAFDVAKSLGITTNR